MKKSVLVTAINTLILASLTACGGGGGGGSSTPANNTETATPTPAETGSTNRGEETTTPPANPETASSCEIYSEIACTSNSSPTASGFTNEDSNATTLIVTVNDPATNNSVKTTYNDKGQPTKNETFIGGNTGSALLTTTYTYDSNTDNLTSEVSSAETTNYIYTNNLISEINKINNISNKLKSKTSLTYSDNKISRKIITNYATDGTTVASTKTTDFTYNAEGKEIRIDNSEPNELDIEKDYDCNGNLKTKTQLKSDGTVAIVENFIYDKNNNLVSTTKKAYGQTVVDTEISTTYFCESLENKRTTKTITPTKTSTNTIQYLYDSEGRLTKIESDSNGDGNINNTKTITYEGNPSIVSKIKD